ncbi:MAG: 4Fe-4S dicluster domain-containing protein [Planctomycetes bacterium]|nr:4Fe-4S dicluster domain-containing protein [Planctomycetota bacterium]
MTEPITSPVAEKYPDCMHCGLCLQVCPTYLQTGDENMSPRGRLYLMKAVDEERIQLADAIPALDLCLDCRACEQACPSGVRYSRILEPMRIRQHQMEKPKRGLAAWMQSQIIPDRRRLKKALIPVRLMQALHLTPLLRGVSKILPKGLRGMIEQLPTLQKTQLDLPAISKPCPKAATEAQARSTSKPSKPAAPKRVAMFLGCASEAMFPVINRATVRVLQAFGCEVHTPDNQVCCGALPYHSGDTAKALDQMATNAITFGALPQMDAIIMNAAGCGAALKEAGILGREIADDKPKLHQALDAMSAITRDVHEFLATLPPPKFNPVPLKAVYDDACHLKHAQGISQPPRQLLQLIPELELLPLPEAEHCCGAAGSYALHQPEMSRQLGMQKANHILNSGADVVLSANIGCIIQIQKSLRELGAAAKHIRVMHPIEILDQALS